MFKKVLGWALGILIVGGVLFLLCGGSGWLWRLAYPPERELKVERVWWERVDQCLPVSDGTAYALTEDGSAFWLVNGKVAKVACEETLWVQSEFSLGDSSGGLYIGGRTHLWYLKDGRVTKVEETSPDNIVPSDHPVTRDTVLWAAMRRYGFVAYKTGYDNGHEAGYDAGRDDPGE